MANVSLISVAFVRDSDGRGLVKWDYIQILLQIPPLRGINGVARRI